MGRELETGKIKFTKRFITKIKLLVLQIAYLVGKSVSMDLVIFNYHFKNTSFVKWHFNFILDPISRHISNPFHVFRIFALFPGQNA